MARDRGEETARRILDAALELFSRQGVAAVSVQEIADRAGVNKASVFYHHDNKAVLLERLLERYYLNYARALELPEQPDDGVRERLHRLLDANLDFIEENLAAVRLVQIQVSLENEHLDRIRGGMSLLYRAVEELLANAAPQRGPLQARQLFVSFSGMINGYFLQARALEPVWGSDPLGVAALRERRQHLHWMMDSVLDGLERASTEDLERHARA